MKTITKVLISSLVISAVGAVLICIPATLPAGIAALYFGAMGSLFSIFPIISLGLEEWK